jgi:hypothetical protein
MADGQQTPKHVARTKKAGRNVVLRDLAGPIKIEQPPTLKDKVATKVLDLFHFSLKGTLIFAAALVLIDAAYIFFKVITPEQRLMSEKIIMTFIAATVVQVGAALAAIVFAVFRSMPNSDDET